MPRPRVLVWRRPPDGVELPDGYYVMPRKSRRDPDTHRPRPASELAKAYQHHNGIICLHDWCRNPSIMSAGGQAFLEKYALDFFPRIPPVDLLVIDDPKVGKKKKHVRDQIIYDAFAPYCNEVTGFGIYYGGCIPGPTMYRSAVEDIRNIVDFADGDAGYVWVAYDGYVRNGGYGRTTPADITMKVQMALDLDCEGVCFWTDKNRTASQWKRTIDAIEAAQWERAGF